LYPWKEEEKKMLIRVEKGDMAGLKNPPV